jgi:TM2 domain-containing membrane protein YozV
MNPHLSLTFLAQAAPAMPEPPNPFLQLFPIGVILIAMIAILLHRRSRDKKESERIVKGRLQQPYYFLSPENEAIGPVTLAELANRSHNPSTFLVCATGSEHWITLEDALSATRKKPILKKDESSEKKALVGVLLCFFLGTFGFHAFYAGRKIRGLIMFILGLWLLGNIFVLMHGGDLPLPILSLFTISALIWIVMWFSDLISLLIGSYTDGEGRSINKW